MKSLLALALLLSTSAAFAADKPSAIDFTQKLTGATGKPLTQGGDDCKPGQIPGKDCSSVQMTLEDAAIEALEGFTDSDRGEDPAKKFHRDQIARDIAKDPAHVSLSVDDLKIVKDRIGAIWNAPQVGAAWPLLDPTLK